VLRASRATCHRVGNEQTAVNVDDIALLEGLVVSSIVSCGERL